VIDAHCHLYSAKYDVDLDQVIQRAKECLSAVVVSAIDAETLRKSLAIRRRYPDFIYVTAGIHPRQSVEITDTEIHRLWRTIDQVRGEVVALGEVGPDFHRTKDPAQRQRQLRVLEEAMGQAEAWNLPLVIHARQAEEAALEVLARSTVPVLYHCFAGNRHIASKIAGLGFYLSFSALLLISSELQEAATRIPQELILTETDSPALSPRPHQRRNEPVFVEMVVSRLAKLLQYRPEQMAAITAANARRFYQIKNNPGIGCSSGVRNSR
jgi:TatD DNase family protein